MHTLNRYVPGFELVTLSLWTSIFSPHSKKTDPFLTFFAWYLAFKPSDTGGGTYKLKQSINGRGHLCLTSPPSSHQVPTPGPTDGEGEKEGKVDIFLVQFSVM